MHCKILLKCFSLLAVISQLQAWVWKNADVANGIAYHDYKGYDPTDEENYDGNERRAFCILPSTQNTNPLYSKGDIIQGVFVKQMMLVSGNLNINIMLCTSKYQGNQQLYIGKGPSEKSLAVYAKSGTDLPKLIGVMTGVDDQNLPAQ